MTKYLIHHRIRTIAYFHKPQDYLGFHFNIYNSEGVNIGLYNHMGDGWVAEKEVEAIGWREAYKNFQNELATIIDAFSVVTQCFFSIVGCCYFIKRLDAQYDGIMLSFVAKEALGAGTGMALNESGLEDVEKLMRENIGVALHYFKEANNAISPITRSAMLLCCAEALAGIENVTKKCKCGEICSRYSRTCNAELSKILEKELYDQAYKRDGLRHKLFHGVKVLEDREVSEFNDKIYDKIIMYLKNRLQLKDVHPIKDPGRSIYTYKKALNFVRNMNGLPQLEHLNDTLYEMLTKKPQEFSNENYEIITDTSSLSSLFKDY